MNDMDGVEKDGGDDFGYVDAWELIRDGMNGTLPEGFDEWDASTVHGLTVAHAAARFGNLPAGFDCWDLKDSLGESVAHFAARHGKLPEDFDDWEMADDDGWTVAHAAAQWGHLPEGFDGWSIACMKPEWSSRYAGTSSWTVAHEAADCGLLPEGVPDPVLMLRDGDGRTVARVLVESEDFDLPPIVLRAAAMLGVAGEIDLESGEPLGDCREGMPGDGEGPSSAWKASRERHGRKPAHSPRREAQDERATGR